MSHRISGPTLITLEPLLAFRDPVGSGAAHALDALVGLVLVVGCLLEGRLAIHVHQPLVEVRASFRSSRVESLDICGTRARLAGRKLIQTTQKRRERRGEKEARKGRAQRI